MRNCTRCHTAMTEGGQIITGDAVPVRISINRKKAFRSDIGTPHVAVCPRCGEISFYIPNVEKHAEKFQKYGDFGDEL